MQPRPQEISGMGRRKFSTWFTLGPLALLLALCSLLPDIVGTPQVTAQEPADPDLAAAEQVVPPPPAEPNPPDPGPGGNAGGPSAAAPARPAQSLLAFYFQALGIRYTVAFLGISFWFVALIVMNFLELRRQRIVPLELIETFEGLLNEKKLQEAYDLAKADDSFLGRVLSAGLARLSAGYEHAIEAMQETGEEENMKLEHRLSYIALVGSISPMVGLLGTVDGMVASFKVIADNPDRTPRPDELASGISMALITTLVGLVIAIPAIGIFGIWRNRVQRLVLEAGIVSEGLMSRFQGMSPKK
jgi:biopolymer transport protein ExbB